MDNTFYLQLIGLIVVLVVVLTLSFYIVYPLVVNGRRPKEEHSPTPKSTPNEELIIEVEEDEDQDEEVSNNNALPSEPENEETPERSSSAPMVSYRSKANEMLADQNRVEDIVERENQGFMGRFPLPDYKDDPASIDLEELAALRRDIRRMAKEISQVRRTNVELKDMIGKLQHDHSDAIKRLEGTDLWSNEKSSWGKDFEKTFRAVQDVWINKPFDTDIEKRRADELSKFDEEINSKK